MRIPDDVCDLRALARHHWHLREDNLWLAVIAAPLALTALALLGQWWAWPVIVVGVVALSPSWRWFWLLAFELAVISSEWAYVGATSLGVATDSGSTALVAVMWIAFPLALAGAGHANRQRHHRAQMRRR